MAIDCSTCGEGHLVERRVPQLDLSDALGLPVVFVDAPALVCGHCGAQTADGSVIDAAAKLLVHHLVEHGDKLEPGEVRFLRSFLGMTQTELATRLGVQARLTVGRWEGEGGGIDGANALALRLLAAAQLGDAALALSLGAKGRKLHKTAKPYPKRLRAA